jgi:hypothetical protein
VHFIEGELVWHKYSETDQKIRDYIGRPRFLREGSVEFRMGTWCSKVVFVLGDHLYFFTNSNFENASDIHAAGA